MTRLLTAESLEFENSPLFLSYDEEKRVFFDATSQLDSGEVVSDADVKAYQLPDETDVTSTLVLLKSVQTTGVYVTLTKAASGTHYRVEVRVTTNYGKHEGFLMLHGAALKNLS